MKKIIAVLLVAAAVYHLGFDSTLGARSVIVERHAALESI